MNNLKTLEFCVFVFLLSAGSFTLKAQSLRFLPKNDVPVNFNSNQLVNPWAGGLNSVHPYRFPLDGDTIEDLIVFDKNAVRKITTYLAKPVPGGGGYHFVYAPEYEPYFPIVDSYIYIIDYNDDGKKDLFTRGIYGIECYKNVTTGSYPPSFISMTYGTAIKFRLPGDSYYNNLQISSYGYPEITDIDNDGDLDILIFDFNDGVRIQWYKNYQAEDNLPADSLRYFMVSDCWGNIFELNRCDSLGFNNFCKPGPPPPTDPTFSAKPAKPLHSGASLSVFDLDNDGDKDLFVSDIVCNNVKYSENKGTVTQPMFDSYILDFPTTGVAANFHQFPRLIFEDLDFDGKKDLFASPNLFNDDAYNANYSFSSYLFKNTGAGAANNFQFIKSNFLQETMIDLGDRAFPFLEDYDQDGDLDLFVGNNYRYVGANYYSTVYLFENVGSSAVPNFVHISSDYMGLSSLDAVDIRPYFADINADGKRDFVFTATSKTTPFSTVKYILNTASTPSQAYALNPSNIQSTNIATQSFDHLAFSDINNDSRTDILLGQAFGYLNYYRNDPDSFVFMTDNFMGFDGTNIDFHMAPFVGDIDNDGLEDLLVGNAYGKLRVYLNFKGSLPNAPAPDTLLILNLLSSLAFMPNFGGLTIPVLGDLNNDSMPELIVGGVGGGLTYFSNQTNVLSLPTAAKNEIIRIELYPNPAENTIKIKEAQDFTIEFYTAIGQLTKKVVLEVQNKEAEINVSDLPEGVYILRFMKAATGQSGARKLVISR